MNASSKLFAFAVAAALVGCGGKKAVADFNVIPLPNQITKIEGEGFTLTKSTKIVYPKNNPDVERIANFLSGYIMQSTGYRLDTTSESQGNSIVLMSQLSADNNEAYTIKVSPEGIVVNGATPAGTFYGVQTLRKAMPATADAKSIKFNNIEISDAPRFKYRGMHLDVSRHFFTADSVKRYIDLLAFHNMNRFHWHLTDDQGWRIEIKKYPELTAIGAHRDETVIGYNESNEFDGKRYGGYYTQEEITEVINYARERFITIIPEIDMPGHMLAALASYPHLGCTGEGYATATKWGVFDDVLCVGKDSVMQFVYDVLDEVTELFPSELIHIGGDECPKASWAKCPRCLAKMQELQLENDGEHTALEKLQSWFMHQVEKYLAGKGRKVIGWDEILEGGIGPDAIVMSWRGMDGGYAAVKQKHDAIMTPNSHLYFDYYQTKDTEGEPLAFNGFIPIEKVYNLNPIPDKLNQEEQKHIIGVQANLWSEYIPTFRHAEYMALPRMCALSEVQWCNHGKRDYFAFLKRLPRITEFFERDGINYSKHIFKIQMEITPNFTDDTDEVTLYSCGNNDNIRYTLDGSTPTLESELYTKPIKINMDCILTATQFDGDSAVKTVKETFNFNKATVKDISLQQQPSLQYKNKGAQMLVDGLHGGQLYSDGRWLGFKGNDIDAIVDLGTPTQISHAAINLNIDPANYIMNGVGLTVYASDDGMEFNEIASKAIPITAAGTLPHITTESIDFDPTTARFFRIVLKNAPLPAWHRAKGEQAFLFADEIILE